jgi:iron complex outermembrane receptor protein
MRTRLGIVLLGGIAGTCLFAGSALAEIETVTVTAEKRAEDIQRVPIAVSAVTGDSLDKTGTIGFKELQNRVPSLRFGAGVTGGENVITMRGLGSQNTTPGGDSPVAYSEDGVYLQRTTAVDPEFYDVERIEVLRGPQGTLYGRNSVGGSVNVINYKPSDTFGGSIDGMIGDYSQHTIRGYLTGPIVDNGSFQILGRATGVWSEHDGYSTNLSTSPTANHNLNNQDFYSLRGQVLINFNPDVNLLLSASLNHDNGVVSPTTAWWETPARFTGGATPIPAGSPCDFGTAALYRARTFCHDAPEKASNEIALYSGTLNWNFDWATFTSVTGYSSSDVSQNSDGDGSDQPIAFGSVWVMRQHQISEEARLASNDDGSPLKWIAGFYYFWSDNHEDFTYFDTGYNDPFPFPGSFDAFTFISHGNTKTKSYAPFGQIDYDLGKTSMDIPLTITFGLRYSHDQKYGYNTLSYQFPLGLGPVFFPPAGFAVNYADLPFTKSWAQTTGKLGLAYQVNDDLMLYASASRGYLAGGNIIGLASTYDPETMWSYEAGFKSKFWDDRAQLNVAAYHEDIKGLQVFIQSATQSGINNVNGMTKVNGLETEFTVEPVDNLQLNATLTLTDAKYGTYITKDGRFGAPPAGCTWQSDGTPTGGNLCNFKGNNLNQTPPYSLNLGAQYTFDTSFGAITPRVDAYFSGRVDFLPDNLSPQKSYTQTNAHLTWVSDDQMYRVEAFVNNIENNDIISNDGLQSITLGQGVLQPDNYAYYPPRTFGIRLGVRF